MRILLVHPDGLSLRYLQTLLAGKGREIQAFAYIEEAMAAASGEYDLAVLRLDGAWCDRGAVEGSVERALGAGQVFWLEEEAAFGGLGAKVPDELLNYCMPSV